MHFFKNIEEKNIDKACYAIGIDARILTEKGESFIENLHSYLHSERFLSPNKNDITAKLKNLKERGVIKTEEEEIEYIKAHNERMKKKQVFCHFGDFDLIHSIFEQRWGIDLMKDDINYFIYTFKLNSILEEESNALINRIKARSFKPQKGKENKEYNKRGAEMKQKYSLY